MTFAVCLPEVRVPGAAKSRNDDQVPLSDVAVA